MRLDKNVFPILNDTSASRKIYVRDNDSGQFWSIGTKSTDTSFDQYQCRHGFGYTIIEASFGGIELSWKIFIPANDPLEIWQVSVGNQGAKKRRLSLFWLVDFAVHSHIPAFTAQYTQNAVTVRGRSPNEPVYFLASSKEVSSFETVRSVFLGAADNFAAPAAVVEGKCARTLASGEPLLGVLQKNTTLGAKTTLQHEIFVGAFLPQSKATLAKTIGPYQKADAVTNAFNEVFNEQEKILQHHRLRSAHTEFDQYYNGFLSYQNLASYQWPEHIIGQPTITITSLARAVRAGLRYQPKVSQRHLIAALGNVMKDGRIATDWTSHSAQVEDSILLAQLCIETTKETGDLTWLRQQVHYYDGGGASVLEHVTRLVESVISHINHHLVVVDGVECAKLSAQTIAVIKELISLHDLLGDHHLEKKYRALIEGMTTAVNKRFWQGPFYERQRDETGHLPAKKGPHTFDLATQTAVMASGIAADRGKRVINAIKKQWPQFVPNISPPYPEANNYPFSAAVPGRGQNGTVDVRLICQLAEQAAYYDDAEYAWHLLQTMLPITDEQHSRSPFWQEDFLNWGKAFSAQNAAGRLGTADAVTKVIQETILGIQPTFGGLKINPHLPKSWRQVEISRHFRGADYHIRIQNPLRVSSGVDRIVVDGIRVIGNTIRPFSTGVHFVEVVMG